MLKHRVGQTNNPPNTIICTINLLLPKILSALIVFFTFAKQRFQPQNQFWLANFSIKLDKFSHFYNVIRKLHKKGV